MASRSDQLQSHQFSARRVVSAVATGDPDPTTAPMRRAGGSVLASVIMAAVLLAAVAVVDLLRPGDDSSWRAGDAVIIEQETGARFVFRGGRLHPVPNYSSALLILGSAEPRQVTVRRARLADLPRSAELGIPGAPEALPSAADLLTAGWTACSRPTGPATESVLLVGATPGLDSSGPGFLGADDLGARALLVADGTGGRHMIWRGRRYLVSDASVVLTAFGWAGQPATPVATAVLNAIPAGAPLRAPTLPTRGLGRPSALPGVRIGQLVMVRNHSGGTQFGLVLASGVADITQVQADLIMSDPAISATTKVSAEPVVLSLTEYASAPHAPSLVPGGAGAPPATTPELAHPSSGGGLCASFVDGEVVPRIGLARGAARGSGEVPVVADRSTAADWVVVPPGRGAIVEVLAGSASASPVGSPEGSAVGAAVGPAVGSAAPNGALVLVTDRGVSYPIPSREVLAILGLPGVPAQRLPAALVAMLPTGPTLDPVAAATPTPVAR